MRHFFPSITLIILGLLLPTLAFSQSNYRQVNLTNAYWIAGLTPAPTKKNLPFRGLRASYDLTWKGKVKAGKATFAVIPNPNRPGFVRAVSTGNTIGLASKLFPYEFDYRANIDARNTLRTTLVKLQETTRKNSTYSQLQFLRDKVSITQSATSVKTGISKTKTVEIVTGKQIAMDAAAVLLGAHFHSLYQNQQITSLVIPMDSPYLTKVTVIGREQHKVRGKNYNTIKMNLEITGKALSNHTIKPYDKVKGCTLWVTDDADRIPLELRADVFIGHVSAVLTDLRYL